MNNTLKFYIKNYMYISSYRLIAEDDIRVDAINDEVAL